jgi:apolipoprotein N-acyltransferase
MNGTAYSPLLRFTAGALVTASRLSLPYLLVLVLVSTDPPVTPEILFRLFAATFVLPALGAAMIERTCRASIDVDEDGVRVRSRYLELDIPRSAIRGAAAWRIPLPHAGVTIALNTGRAAPYTLGVANPREFLEAFGGKNVELSSPSPLSAWAFARAHATRSDWRHMLLKYAGFGALPAAVLFNAHQHIAYGGFWGQYYTQGVGAWARTFAIYWATTAIYVLLFAALIRGVGEGFAILATHVAPARALQVRRGVERFCRIAYYVGVPALLGIRFLP